MIPFTYAIVDDDGEILRKYRWSAKEAKWHKDQGKNVIALPKEKAPSQQNVQQELFNLVGEALY
jgi:hypothetical protein